MFHKEYDLFHKEKLSFGKISNRIVCLLSWLYFKFHFEKWSIIFFELIGSIESVGLESDEPRAKRGMFVNGMLAVPIAR